MNELQIHLRKDLKLLTSDSLFVVLLVTLAAIAFIIGLIAWTGYVSSIAYGNDITTTGYIEYQQKSALVNYWSSIGAIYMTVFLVLAALAMSVEKESGMSKYVLTFKVRKPVFYISKLIVLTMLALLAIVIALVAYLVVFSTLDVPMLDAGSLAASMLFPLLSMLSFASVGLVLSTVTSKKGAMIVAAIVLSILLPLLWSASYYAGVKAAADINPQAQQNNYTEFMFMPLEYKVLVFANPYVLSQGTSYVMDTSSGYSPMYDILGGIAIAIVQVAMFTLLGMLLFTRERSERGLVPSLLSLRRKGA